ncbi:MAG: hypothetical protein A2V78_07355 [Betaproteobacteria bacterium RBG_16_64_18]|nr:MAG: hypothetical protein A2V78_07355 [Betaproteobacteria bacterium RBG_16_64_18]
MRRSALAPQTLSPAFLVGAIERFLEGHQIFGRGRKHAQRRAPWAAPAAGAFDAAPDQSG